MRNLGWVCNRDSLDKNRHSCGILSGMHFLPAATPYKGLQRAASLQGYVDCMFAPNAVPLHVSLALEIGVKNMAWKYRLKLSMVQFRMARPPDSSLEPHCPTDYLSRILYENIENRDLTTTGK